MTEKNMILLKYLLVLISPISGEEHCSTCNFGYKSITTENDTLKCYRTIFHDDTISSAAKKCKSNGEKLPLPKTKDENDKLQEIVKGFQVFIESYAPTQNYIPLDLKYELNNYVDSSGNNPTFKSLVENYQPSKTKFVGLNFKSNDSRWFSLSGTDKIECIVCQQLCKGNFFRTNNQALERIEPSIVL